MGKNNIILDVDGTLWNTTDIVAKAWEGALHGRSNAKVTADRLKQLFGKPMNVIGDELFCDVDPSKRKEILDDCCEAEQAALEKIEQDILYSGVARTIKSMAVEQGKRLFIVSNCQSGYIELFLAKNKFEPYVQDIECFGNNGFSKGENIALIIERNNLSIEETVYVGDTKGDQEASLAAGVDFVYAAYGFGNVTEYYKAINSFDELLEI